MTRPVHERRSVQGRTCDLVPTALSKGRAAWRLADNAGLGSTSSHSLLDQDLLAVPDCAIRPQHGQLESLGYDGVAVPERDGASAA